MLRSPNASAPGPIAIDTAPIARGAGTDRRRQHAVGARHEHGRALPRAHRQGRLVTDRDRAVAVAAGLVAERHRGVAGGAGTVTQRGTEIAEGGGAEAERRSALPQRQAERTDRRAVVAQRGRAVTEGGGAVAGGEAGSTGGDRVVAYRDRGIAAVHRAVGLEILVGRSDIGGADQRVLCLLLDGCILLRVVRSGELPPSVRTAWPPSCGLRSFGRALAGAASSMPIAHARLHEMSLRRPATSCVPDAAAVPDADSDASALPLTSLLRISFI